MHMAAVDLTSPAIADFDFTVARGSAVADHEMVGEAVAHAADIPVVVIKDAGVPLPGSTVVDDNELPALAQDRRPVDLRPDRAGQVLVAFAEEMKGKKRKAARLLVA